MLICASCGRETPEGFPRCANCGATLDAPVEREVRKTVTLLFCDVTGSTALGESTDPEALRALLARYFERMKAIVEAHGGTVEKFIGDAVMAVFGAPVAHEDDALRACRAAVEMRDAFPELGINGRVGVNTGEVVTGTEERLATGDAVNVAARLEQAAAPGEVLIGTRTLALVASAVDVEAVDPLTLKGKSKPVAAYRLLAATGMPERRFSTPMIGREQELQRVRDAFAQAAQSRSCQLFTVLGSAGVGKSRLATEFLAGTEARILRGRCLSYGEGITYWPVVEILKRDTTLPDGDAARPLRRAARRGRPRSRPRERSPGGSASCSSRKRRHSRSSACSTICTGPRRRCSIWSSTSRVSLAARRSSCSAWPGRSCSNGGPPGAAASGTRRPSCSSRLTPPRARSCSPSSAGVRRSCASGSSDAAEGNPLFLEEMLALVRDSPDGNVDVPPTIQALLAARLDQLDPAERSVLERGSVEGRTFHRGAVAALADGRRRGRRPVARLGAQGAHPPRPCRSSRTTPPTASAIS